MKQLLPFFLGALIGAALLLGGAYAYFKPRLDIALADAMTSQAKLQNELAQQQTLNEKIARLEKEYADQQAYIEKLHAERDAAPTRASANQAQSTTGTPPAPEPVGNLLDNWVDTMEEDAEEQARREEWRNSFRERMRENVDGFINDAMAAAGTPEERERLTAISEYSNYLMETRDRMRDAQTDEERDAIRDEMIAASDELRGLMREQQADMVDDVVAQYGVTDPAQQQRLMRDLRSVMESPFFGAERFLSGFGRDRGRGGFGGPPGFGPRRNGGRR